MQPSIISKLLMQSKSIEDEQAYEWVQLKVDTKNGHNLSKIICHKNITCINLFFSVCGRLSVTEKNIDM